MKGHQEEWVLAADPRLGKAAARTSGMCDTCYQGFPLAHTGATKGMQRALGAKGMLSKACLGSGAVNIFHVTMVLSREGTL